MADTSIGQISSLEGTVTIITEAGETRTAAIGMPVSVHDTVKTAEGATVEIDFTDGTTFAMSPNSVMAVSKFVYDADGADNGFLIDFTQGAFEFVAGKVAHLFGDGMQVTTPAGTLGVRGTAGAATQDPNTGEWTFMLLKDPNGHLGKIALINANGEVLLDDWMEASVLRNGVAPTTPNTLSTSDVAAIFGATTGMIQELRGVNPGLDTHESGDQPGDQGSVPGVDNVDTQAAHEATSGGIGGTIEHPVSEAQAGSLEARSEAAAEGIPAIQLVINLGASHSGDGAAGALGNEEERETITFDDLFESSLIAMPGEIHTYVPVDDTATPPSPGPSDPSDPSDPGPSDPVDPPVVDIGTDPTTSVPYDSVGYVSSGSGSGSVTGTAGDETFWSDNTDIVDGGAGIDTWRMHHLTTANIDLSQINFSGIERIDMSSVDGVTLTLSAQDVLDMSDTDTLHIFGVHAANTIATHGDSLVYQGTSVVNGVNANIYQFGGATLIISDDIPTS